mgnify:CR=1 FL=1
MSSKYKALIIYSSITGNTEKIANAFAETFREYNIEPTLKKLEGKGYVQRERNPKDERVLYVSLTRQGEQLKDRAIKTNIGAYKKRKIRPI